jgi:hypothetical protein
MTSVTFERRGDYPTGARIELAGQAEDGPVVITSHGADFGALLVDANQATYRDSYFPRQA